MKTWVWTLKRGLKHAGWMGIAGISLLIFSATFYLTAVMPEMKHLSQLNEETISLRQRAQETVKHGGINTSNNTESQLTAYYHFFPSARNKNDWLAKIYSAAEHQSLMLEAGEYRFVPDQDRKLSRYMVALPVKGSYVQIRKFINEILAEIPVAAVEDISFKRETIDSTNLDARIKLTLFFGGA